MIPPQERIRQIARLVGLDVFRARFGPPQTAEPPREDLDALIGERIAEVGRALVEEAAASDDVVDAASAEAYLDDRLQTLGDLLGSEQADAIRAAFRAGTNDW